MLLAADLLPLDLQLHVELLHLLTLVLQLLSELLQLLLQVTDLRRQVNTTSTSEETTTQIFSALLVVATNSLLTLKQKMQISKDTTVLMFFSPLRRTKKRIYTLHAVAVTPTH